ncbi:hypothetical protein ABJF43_002520 [Listeria monocytogenes]|uniref:HK97 gp10 family phage protein n=1 Tax=Listeria monocytogenes TaxID=1639 RepID=A0A9P1T3E3_LISMN|nr:hypothetical protein [Listeria monocytogenes]MCZ64194.1 hypothetical protein [Listeria monocytogenes serotype 4b]EAA0129580.1 hypothetical protein [Listeria monocytogenes]EAC2291050.1 hypothetical protein [Listeria monocytogenes]EAC2303802.1 hypothetical protein [Listeria monocytogenes]EAC3065861.1 hypothetical protein [Listeria monocytogenes]
MVRFELDASDLEQLLKKIADSPGDVEKAINQSLEKEGAPLAIEGIIRRMPVSQRGAKKVREKSHAKFSNPLIKRMENLGFEIVAKGGASSKKGSFGYLAFPDEGRGSSNLIAQHFFNEGMTDRTPRILEALNEALDRAIEF